MVGSKPCSVSPLCRYQCSILRNHHRVRRRIHFCIRQGIPEYGWSDSAQSGVPANVAEKCLAKMTGHKDKWFETIDNSFLPDDLKGRYKELILARLSML